MVQTVNPPVTDPPTQPGNAPLPDLPFAPVAPPTGVQNVREYVAGGAGRWQVFYGKTAQTLPHPIDDVAQDFGYDIYERMARDPQVAACVIIFKASILETGPSIVPPITDKDDPEYEKAKEICDQAIRSLADMEESFNVMLWSLLDSIYVGNKVAEITHQMGPALKDGRGIYLFDKIKVKDQLATRYAVDPYSNVVGLLVRRPDAWEPLEGQTLWQDSASPGRFQLISKQKFIISTFRKHDEDPRGTSIARPAYAPWWRKQQIIPEYLKYLTQFASPSLVGKVSPDAIEVPVNPNDPSAGILTPQQVLLAAMQAFHNGTAIALDNGADVHEIQMQGEGRAFLSGLVNSDQQITKAILTQELATEQSDHQARAAAEVHQDVLDTLIRQGKLSLQDDIRKQLFRRWVIMNWGPDYAHLAPIADFGATEARDQPSLWQAAAALNNSKYFARDQLQALDSKLGLPVRQIASALAFELAEDAAKKAASAPASSNSDSADPQPQQEQQRDPSKVYVPAHERNKPNRQQENDPQKQDQPANGGGQ